MWGSHRLRCRGRFVWKAQAADRIISVTDVTWYRISYRIFVCWKPWQNSMNTLSQYIILARNNPSRSRIIKRQNRQSFVDYSCSEIEKRCSNWIRQCIIRILCRSKECSKRCRRNRSKQQRRIDKRWKIAPLIYYFYYAWRKWRLYCCTPGTRYREQEA